MIDDDALLLTWDTLCILGYRIHYILVKWLKEFLNSLIIGSAESGHTLD